MISIRVSEREYETMRAIYASYGARNVSECARLAVQRAIGNSFRSDMAVASTLIMAVTRSGLAEPARFLAAGSKVFPDRGPLAGLDGIVEKVDNRFRLTVSVTLLQRSVPVEVDPNCTACPAIGCGNIAVVEKALTAGNLEGYS
jgi:transcription antitermination factor NusG